jgi:hypothetical protein
MIVFGTMGRSSAGRERRPRREARVEPDRPRSGGRMSEKDEKELGEFMNMRTAHGTNTCSSCSLTSATAHRTEAESAISTFRGTWTWNVSPTICMIRPTYVRHGNTTSAKRTAPGYSVITSSSRPRTVVTISSDLCLFALRSLSPSPLHPHAISLPTSNLNCAKTSPSPGTALDDSNPTIGPFHCLLPSPDAAAPVGDICGPLCPTTSEGLFPHSEGVLEASSIHFRIYAYIEDHL